MDPEVYGLVSARSGRHVSLFCFVCPLGRRAGFPFGLSGRPGLSSLGGTRSLVTGKYRFCVSMQVLAALGT